MMQAADLGNRYNRPHLHRLNRSHNRGVLGQREVRAGMLVVFEVGFEDSAQPAFIQHDHMIQTFASDRADQPLDIGVFSGRLCGRENFPNAEPLRGFGELLAIASISVAQEIPRGAVPRGSFEHLMGHPFRGGVFRHRNMGDSPTIMRQNHEDEQHPKENRRNHEEIRGDQILHMVC